MEVRQNSLRAWFLAARPKTLFGAVSPVLVGAALAWATLAALGQGTTRWIVPSLLCAVFALVMQIDANFINDYFDFIRGADSEERLGPERACTKGWISPRAMKRGIAITSTLAFITGLPLIFYGGYAMLAVGLLCILGAFLYTTKFSYTALGDTMVVLYFGIVPVFFTWFTSTWLFCNITAYYFLMGALALIAGFAVGFIVDNLLIVNNYRDRELDARNGKRTLVVRLGAKAAEWLYLINGCVATIGAMIVGGWLARGVALKSEANLWAFPFHLVLPLLFLPFLFKVHRKMVELNHGRELNSILGKTSRNILIFSLLFVVLIVVEVLPVWYNG